MLTPDSASDDNAASVETGVSLASMVTVAEPTAPPPWDAVTTTVSSLSSSLSSTAVTVAVTDMSPAASVNDDDDSE
jgi:hypothetical protein